MKVTSGRRVARIVAATGAAATLLAAAPAMAASGPKPVPTIPPSARIAPHVSHPSSGTPVTPQQLRRFASQDGGCDVGDVCLYYYNSSLGFGSSYDTSHNDPNLFNNHFISFGAGQRAVVGSNAEAVWNRDPHTYVELCTGLNNTGTCGFVPPNTWYNLSTTFSNHVQSLHWDDSTN